jgi:hypothetical protein
MMSHYSWQRVRARKEAGKQRRDEQVAAARAVVTAKRAKVEAERAAAKRINDAGEARAAKFTAAYNAWVAAGAQGEFVDPTDTAPPPPPEPPPGPFTKLFKEKSK